MPTAEYPWQIPLRSAKGQPAAWAVVDPEVYPEAMRWNWGLTARGYAMRTQRIFGRVCKVYLHRDILGLGLYRDDSRQGDHINRDKLDNRRVNLRIVTARENNENHPGYPHTSSRFRGVGLTPSSTNWRARGTYTDESGKRHHVHIGTFTDELDAAAAAAQWRRKYLPASVEDPVLLARPVPVSLPVGHHGKARNDSALHVSAT